MLRHSNFKKKQISQMIGPCSPFVFSHMWCLFFFCCQIWRQRVNPSLIFVPFLKSWNADCSCENESVNCSLQCVFEKQSYPLPVPIMASLLLKEVWLKIQEIVRMCRTQGDIICHGAMLTLKKRDLLLRLCYLFSKGLTATCDIFSLALCNFLWKH